jgi:hypothetical protein
MSIAGRATIVLAVLLAGRTALAWDAAWAIRDDADWRYELEILANATIPLTTPPGEVHGLGGVLGGGVRYLDDDKAARLQVGTLDYTSIYRDDRDRYDAGSFPSVALFDLAVQLRLRPDLHLLYGLGLIRGGVRSHTSAGGLAFHLGWALPLRRWQTESMRDYQLSYLQLECIPLAGSFLSDMIEEGYRDQEMPAVQLLGEVGLSGRLRTRGGILIGAAHLSFSYLHQHSLYFVLRLRYLGPAFWRQRVRLVLEGTYVWPGRPLETHVSAEAQELLYDHHLRFSLGFVIGL